MTRSCRWRLVERKKSRNAALSKTPTDQDVCSYDCASTALKEFDVWHLAVADRGFLRLVVYPEANTGFVKKSAASGMRWSVKVSRSMRMWAPRRRVVCFRNHAETVSVVRKEDALSPRQFQRPDQPKLLDGRSNSLSLMTENHFNINDVANVLERPRLRGAMSTSIPNDVSTTCRISWCGGVERKTKSRRTAGEFICRGVLLSLQKRAQESKIFRGEALHLRRMLALEKLRWSSFHQLLARPGLTKTRLWKDQPWNVELLSRRWWQVLVSLLQLFLSGPVLTVERRKRLRCQLRPFLVVSAMVMARTVKALREIKSGRCSLCKGVGRTGLCTTWSCLFSTGCDVCGKKGQTDHRKLYHGTSAAFAKAMERNGFKVSKDGMFGPGVYTEKAAIFAAQHETKRGFGVVFVLDVDLGRCKTHYALGCSKSHQLYCQCRRWLQENCESQEVHAGAGIKRTRGKLPSWA